MLFYKQFKLVLTPGKHHFYYGNSGTVQRGLHLTFRQVTWGQSDYLSVQVFLVTL